MVGRGRNAELLFNGYRVSFWEDEKRLEIVVMVAQCQCVLKNG